MKFATIPCCCCDHCRLFGCRYSDFSLCENSWLEPVDQGWYALTITQGYLSGPAFVGCWPTGPDITVECPESCASAQWTFTRDANDWLARVVLAPSDYACAPAGACLNDAVPDDCFLRAATLINIPATRAVDFTVDGILRYNTLDEVAITFVPVCHDELTDEDYILWYRSASALTGDHCKSTEENYADSVEMAAGYWIVEVHYLAQSIAPDDRSDYGYAEFRFDLTDENKVDCELAA